MCSSQGDSAVSHLPADIHKRLDSRVVSIVQVRACGLCIYARHVNPSEHSACWHPRVTYKRGPVPLNDARAVGGACGPEAIYMHFPGMK